MEVKENRSQSRQLADDRGWAEKHRPERFDEVIGQAQVIATLKGLIRRKQRNSLLFHGKSGCGKTTLAKIFTAAMNCSNLGEDCEPCGQCKTCKEVFNRPNPVCFHEIDSTVSRGIDVARDLKTAAQAINFWAPYRVFFIDEAHALLHQSQEGLLKVIEDLPGKSIFILATTEEDKLIDTLKNRCLSLFVQPPSVDELVEHLKNIIKAENCPWLLNEEDCLRLIAIETGGQIRNAVLAVQKVILEVETKNPSSQEIRSKVQTILDQMKSVEQNSSTAAIRFLYGLYKRDIHLSLTTLIGSDDIEQMLEDVRMLQNSLHLSMVDIRPSNSRGQDFCQVIQEKLRDDLKKENVFGLTKSMGAWTLQNAKSKNQQIQQLIGYATELVVA